MKEKIKKFSKIFISIILIILFIIVFFHNKMLYQDSIDDILFFKSLSNKKIKSKEYKFKLKYNNMDFKTIELSEKIAPGTKGSFDIVLEANQKLNYNIQFVSISRKPQNLQFELIKDDVSINTSNTLEELSDTMKGVIKQNENIKYRVNWYWNYEENSELKDIQDTIDAKTIDKYQFMIYAIGEEFT